GAPFHRYDEATMKTIMNGGSDPFWTALFAAVIMLISSLSLWGSPYIAYQLSVGRVYEGVSQTISSWVSTLAGAGIGYYNASLGASISRQADVLQADAQKEAEGIRASAGAEAGERFARAAKILGQTQTNASASYQNTMASLGAKYQIATA